MQSKIKALASDTLVYGVSTTVGRFLTFLLTPLYTNYMSAAENGDVTNIYAVIAFVNILFTLGMEPAFMRYWSKDKPEESRLAFSAAFASIVVLCMAVTSIIVLCAGFVAQSSFLKLQGDGAGIVRIAAFIPLMDALVLIPFSLLRMERRPKRFALYRFLAVVAHMLFNILFVVHLGWRVEGVVWSGVASSGITFLLMIPIVTKNLRVPISWKLVREMFGFGLPTVPSSFSSNIVQVADRPIMTSLLNSAAVGVYQTNFKLGIPMMLFVSVFETAWRPFFLQHANEPDAKQTFSRILTLFTVVCGIVFLVTSLFIPYIVKMPFIGGRFINPAYWYALPIVPVVLLAFFISGISSNLVAGLYIARQTKLLPIATGVSAVVNVLATLALVPTLGMMGAGWAKVAAFAAGAAILAVFQYRVYPIRYDIRNVTLAVAICAALYFGIGLVPDGGMMPVLLRILALPVYVAALAATGVLGPQSLAIIKRLVRR